MKFEDLFGNKPLTATCGGNKKLYDVRITLNKSGANRFAIRFGLLNEAKEKFKGYTFMQISQVEKCQDRIYFRPKKEKQFADDYKLSVNQAKTPGLYFAFTPTKEADKIYRTKWLNQTLKLKFDKEYKCYYIELPPTTDAPE